METHLSLHTCRTKARPHPEGFMKRKGSKKLQFIKMADGGKEEVEVRGKRMCNLHMGYVPVSECLVTKSDSL